MCSLVICNSLALTFPNYISEYTVRPMICLSYGFKFDLSSTNIYSNLHEVINPIYVSLLISSVSKAKFLKTAKRVV